MSRIFVSYGREDRTFTRELATLLRRVYDHVWFDENLYGGEEWWPEIRKQIAQSDIFMFMLSEDSANSPYCRKEFDEAVSSKKEILPIRIKPIQNIPDYLSAIQFVDISSGTITADNVTELTAAINRLSDKIAQRLRDEQARLLSMRRRSTTLRWLAAGVVGVLLAVIGFLLVTQMPSFQGQIAYLTRNGANLEIEVIRGGIPGLFRNIVMQNPSSIQIADVFPAEGTGFTLSPDGSQIAFVSSRRDANLEIYVMNADGTNLQRLTTNTAEDTDPTWSPDGSKIAFASNRDGNWEIYEMDADGQNQVNLTNNRADDQTPAWSPADGRMIAFASNREDRDGGDWDIYRLDISSGSLLNLTGRLPEDNEHPSWSPNGQFVAFESNSIQQDAIDPLGDIGLDTITTDTMPCAPTNRDIYVTDADGIELTWLVRDKNADDRYPSWSPDSQYIVYTSNRGENSNLYIIPVNDRTGNGESMLLTRDNQADNSFPVWLS